MIKMKKVTTTTMSVKNKERVKKKQDLTFKGVRHNRMNLHSKESLTSKDTT